MNFKAAGTSFAVFRKETWCAGQTPHSPDCLVHDYI